MVATNSPIENVSPAAPTAEFIEAFNAQLREAKAEALSVLVMLLRLNTDKDIAIRTQQRLAATAILRTKELKLPKSPRQPRANKPLSHEMGEDRPRRQLRSGEGKSPAHNVHPSAPPIPRSLKNIDTPTLLLLAEHACDPESTYSGYEKIRIIKKLAMEEARWQREQCRALRRRPDS